MNELAVGIAGLVIGFIIGLVYYEISITFGKQPNTMRIIKRVVIACLITSLLTTPAPIKAQGPGDGNTIFTIYPIEGLLGYYDCTTSMMWDYNYFMFYIAAIWAGYSPHAYCYAY